MTEETAQRAPRPWWVAVVAGMASYIDATALSSFGTAIVIFQGALGLTPGEVGLASGSLTFGVAVGALVGGRAGDRYGRRPIFTITMILIVLGAAMLVLATSFPFVLAGALLVGFAAGADLPVSLSTIAEAADDTNRGKLLAFSNLLWAAGAIVAIVLGGVVGNLGRLGGQVLFAHVGIVAVFVLLARLTIPESGSWITARRERLAGTAAASADRAATRALLRGPYRAPFLGLITFSALTGLATNTSGQFGTYLLVNVAGIDVSTATLLSLPFLPLGIFGVLWFMRIADSPRRFTYFTAGAVLWVIGLLVPTVFGITLVSYMLLALFALAGASFSGEGIMKVWTQEQFPTLLRSTAQGSVIAVGRFLAAILASVTPIIVEAGPRMLYGLLTLVAAVGLGTAWVLFRTRDRHRQFEPEPLTDPRPAVHPLKPRNT